MRWGGGRGKSPQLFASVNTWDEFFVGLAVDERKPSGIESGPLDADGLLEKNVGHGSRERDAPLSGADLGVRACGVVRNFPG